MKKILLLSSIIITLIFIAAGCKQSGEIEGRAGEPLSDTGYFSFCIKQAGSVASLEVKTKPEAVTALVITIDQVEVHRLGDSDAGWSDIDIEESTFDLMELGTIEEVIASSQIPTGEYNQLRFRINTAQVTTESGDYEADIPSGKLKINVSFTVFEDGSTEVTISIDPKASLVVAGNPSNPKYLLKPVIHVVGVEEEED